jgi:hypothetical protein
VATVALAAAGATTSPVNFAVAAPATAAAGAPVSRIQRHDQLIPQFSHSSAATTSPMTPMPPIQIAEPTGPKRMSSCSTPTEPIVPPGRSGSDAVCLKSKAWKPATHRASMVTPVMRRARCERLVPTTPEMSTMPPRA